MHHRNEERALWVYDIHLLASRLTASAFQAFVDLARDRKVAAICDQALGRAQRAFNTPIDGSSRSRLASNEPEPSAAYLVSGRRWHDELMSSVRDTRTLGGKIRLLGQVLFPSARYMLAAYGFRHTGLGRLLLPALYVHRNIAGAVKVLAGKK
jgi:hypothetical protein